MALLVAIPAGMALIGKALAALDRRYALRTTGGADRYRPGWLKSMRADRKGSSGWKVLDVVMMWSLSMAGLAMAVWFFFFAGSSI